MIKKVKKDLANAEKEKARLTTKRTEIDQQIDELSQRIKTLNSFIVQYNKMESSMSEFLNTTSKNETINDTNSVL